MCPFFPLLIHQFHKVEEFFVWGIFFFFLLLLCYGKYIFLRAIFIFVQRGEINKSKIGFFQTCLDRIFHSFAVFGLIVSKFCAEDSAKVHLRFGSHIP